MGMIDRYRKKGGFIQLVNLLETTGLEKRDKFLKLIAEENPAWEAAVKKKMISIERITTWNTNYLMEFLPHIPPMALACAMMALPPEKQQHLMSSLSYGDRRKVESAIQESKPNPGEISASQIKIINEIRSMAALGKIKFDKVDPDLVVPDNIEEMLDLGDLGHLSPPSPEEVAAASQTSPPSSNFVEELALLRRKLVVLTQENHRLQKENKEIREKVENVVDQLKKIA